MPDTPDDHKLGPGPDRKLLPDDRRPLGEAFTHAPNRDLEQSFLDHNRGDASAVGDQFADPTLADRHRLGESFADPNSLDDTKVGDSFVDANSTPKHVKQRRREAEDGARKPANYRIFFLVCLIVLILFLVAFFAGFLPRHERTKQLAQQARTEQSATPTVDALRVGKAPAGAPLVVPGTTTPLTEAFIYARANGYLKRRLVDLGDRVHRGQLLAIIDSPDLDQQVDQAREQLRQAESQLTQQQAQLALARVTVERYRVLVAKGVFSRQDGDTQETNFNAQIANVAAAQRNVDAFRANLAHEISLQSYERVTSPFEGVITQRNVDLGSLISAQGTGSSGSVPTGQSTPGQTSAGSANTAGTTGSAPTASTPSTGGGQGGPLFAVAQVDRLRILVSVPEGYASSIHPGQNATLRFQEFPSAQFSGLVTRTASSIDQNTRTLLTEVQVDNRKGQLLNGMYTVVTFAPAVSGQGPITISGDAVAVRNGLNVVGVIRGDGTVHIQPIDVGRDFGPVIEVLGGLKSGDLIASNVSDDIVEGAKVNAHVAQQKSQAAPAAPQAQNQPVGGSTQYGDQSVTDANMQGVNGGGGQKAGGKPGSKPADPSKGESKP